MPTDHWNEALDTGNDAIDRAHRKLLDDIERTRALPDADFTAACLAVFDAVGRDFRAEEELMEKIAYPGESVHREQHARVLGGVHHAEAALLRGDPFPARRCLELLPQWMQLHFETQDAPLAVALSILPATSAT
ncbi:MAG TPA: hemerythrin family protein [Telluria sp.]|nr:hemerythrin family protein [Telluria sp.]